jgi:hypothetical protein
MKKLVVIAIAAVLALASCSSTNPYAGKYTGTFTFVSQNVTANGSLRILTNPLTTGLLVYGVIPIEPVAGNTTMYASTADNSALVKQVLDIIGSQFQNNIYNAATEQIDNVTVEATFNGNTVNMDLYYTVSLLNDILNTRISIVRFTGTK